MEFVIQLIESAQFASAIAFAAFLLSVLSFIWTRRSAKISKQALDESIKNNDRNKESEIEQKRYELLKAISEEFAKLQIQLTLIGALKADFDASHDVAKTLMGDRVNLFTETLHILENYKTDVENRHLGAANWDTEKGVPELLKLQAEQDVAMVNTQHFVDCNVSVITEFREKLIMAQQYQSGATRATDT
jgi:hypothetical protein